MARYIDADALLEKRWDVPFETNDAHYVQVVDVADIENAPTADVVEVVRCEGCKHFYEYRDEYKSKVEGADGDCYIRILNSDNHQFCGVKYNDYCSLGERKTDNEQV